MAGVNKNIEGCRRKLANEEFVNKAPAEVVEKEKTRLAESEARLLRIKENIESLRRA